MTTFAAPTSPVASDAIDRALVALLHVPAEQLSPARYADFVQRVACLATDMLTEED